MVRNASVLLDEVIACFYIANCYPELSGEEEDAGLIRTFEGAIAYVREAPTDPYRFNPYEALNGVQVPRCRYVAFSQGEQ